MHQKSKHNEEQSNLNILKHSWEAMYGYTVGTFRSFSNYSLICARNLSQWTSLQLDYLHEKIPALSVLLHGCIFRVPHRYFKIWITTHDVLISTEWSVTLFTKHASHSTASVQCNVQQETHCHGRRN